jgi:hypothetical protein
LDPLPGDGTAFVTARCSTLPSSLPGAEITTSITTEA